MLRNVVANCLLICCAADDTNHELMDIEEAQHCSLKKGKTGKQTKVMEGLMNRHVFVMSNTYVTNYTTNFKYFFYIDYWHCSTKQ